MPGIYFDHNATTPVDPRVLESMIPYFSDVFGNAASIEHAHGHAAGAGVEAARSQVAQCIGAVPEEVIFTGGCTEANNIAILGAAAANPGKRHLITTAIEHPAVLETCRHLSRTGYELTIVGVDADGRVSPDAIRDAIRSNTLLVSVMAANNEVGTIQPLAEIGLVCNAGGALFHSDMAQVPAYVAVDVRKLGLSLASFSAHKAYGPKGVGALYIRGRRPRIRLEPVIYGGGQERGLRSGTIATPLVVGMGSAFAIAAKNRVGDADRLSKLCRRLLERLRARVEGISLNGHPSERLPNNLSISIDGVEPLALMRLLRDQLSFSATSACATDKVRTSHVLIAMFGDTHRARNAFRLAPGRFSTEADASFAVDAIATAVERLRQTVI